MRYIISHLVFLICFVAFVHEADANMDLQQIIDDAGEGATIHLSAGTYEGNVSISKGITLIGDEKVILLPKNPEEPVIAVTGAKDVSIQNLQLRTSGTGILIKNSENVQLSNVSMNHVYSGVEIYNSKQIDIRQVAVTGNDQDFANKRNGIAIYDSYDLSIKHNKISKVQDGIYIENAKGITVKGNRVENSRYGTHFMYSADAEASENKFRKNVTGFMIMMTENVSLFNNDISYQNGFNGTGITLYEVKNIEIQKHTVSGNRVALSIQKSDGVTISDNIFQMNQTAIESIQSGTNLVAKNDFVGNLVNVRSDVKGIQLQENYYDDYAGIDIDDDGIGDESYVALQSFGQWIVRKPVYQYYVEAPSVVLLNQIDQQTNKTAKQLLVDETPATQFERDKAFHFQFHLPQLIIGLIFTIGCIAIWRRSVLI